MKLSFEQNMIPEHIEKELDFDSFLSLFNTDIPMIPYKILYPLDRKTGVFHYEELKRLDTTVTKKNIEPKAIIEQISKIPCLEEVLPFFKTGELEQFHLFELGNFIKENKVLLNLDENNFKNIFSGFLKEIFDILSSFMESDFSTLKLSADECRLQKKIEQEEAKAVAELNKYEKEIFQMTGLKMIYPYPKEIKSDSENICKIRSCSLLCVSKESDICFIDYNLPDNFKEIIFKKERLSNEFEQMMRQKLACINLKLKHFYNEFNAYYEQVKNRAYQYILLLVKKKNNLVFPDFNDLKYQNYFGCRMEKAELPYLNQKISGYIPLDIDLKKGANLLFGANMTGKTTVLKTLYFHLTLIRAGLPVPARSIKLHFPEQADLHLKTSGNLNRNLSGFGEEIEFFCKALKPYSYILSDELFQSTDPVNGVELSKIFLLEHTNMDGIFLCTSHYPELLHLKDIILFRMKDINENKNISNIPYTVEKICHDRIKEALKQNSRPLEIALKFPLSNSIKNKIRKHLFKKLNK